MILITFTGRDPYFNGQLEDKFMTGNFLDNGGGGGGRGKTISKPKSPSPRSPPGPSLNEKEDDDETIMPRISLSPAKVPAVYIGSGKGRSGRGTLKKGMGIRGGAMPGRENFLIIFITWGYFAQGFATKWVSN